MHDTLLSLNLVKILSDMKIFTEWLLIRYRMVTFEINRVNVKSNRKIIVWR